MVEINTWQYYLMLVGDVLGGIFLIYLAVLRVMSKMFDDKKKKK